MRYRRPAILSKLPVCLFLALVASGQAASCLHQITEHHGVCAEHGEPVDLGRIQSAEADGDTAQPPRLSVAQADASLSTLRTYTAGENVDHHCVVATGRREWSWTCAHVVPSCETAGAPLALESETAGAVSLPILRFAPKHSPPAA